MYYYLNSYRKALKVIDSCKNEYHLKGARNFCNNFFKHHAKEGPIKLGFTTYITGQHISNMYERLLEKLFRKELEIRK